MEVLGDYIAVKTIKTQEKMAGGLMTFSNKESEAMLVQKGKITHIGTLVPDVVKSNIKVDDVLLYTKARTYDMKVKSETYTMVPTQAIVAIE